MAIKPIDVRRKEFKNSFRGYNADEVDDFLDTVADEFEHTYSENLRMREEISSLRERLEQFEKLEDSIQSALVQAEQAANDVRESATREAEDLRESATREAEDLRASANREAENTRNNTNREAELIVKEAQERAQQTLADSSSKVDRAQESYETIKKVKQNFGADFRHLLRSYIDVMDNVDIIATKDIEASLRERLDWEATTTARKAASEREENAGKPDETQQTNRNESDTGIGDPEPEEEPEVEEPEVEPSSVDQDTRAETADTDNDAVGEVEDEETSLARENGETEASHEEDSEEDKVKASRASRFLRKRG